MSLFFTIVIFVIPHASVAESILKASANSPLSNSTTKLLQFSLNAPFTLKEKETKSVEWVFSGNISRMQILHDKKIIEVSNITISPDRKSHFNDLSNFTHEGTITSGNFSLTGRLVGIGSLTINLYDFENKIIYNQEEEVMVLLLARKLNDIYSLTAVSLSAFTYTMMGCKLDLEVIKAIIKRPIGPAIGFLCQYGIMPVSAFLLGLLFFKESIHLRLGLLAIGCSPGGGLSNIWTYFFGASLDLSVMMTFISTIASLGMTTLWITTLGGVVADLKFVIPYKNVAATIAIIVLPIFLGIFFQLKFPKIAPFLKKALPFTAVADMTFTLTFGVYVNFYIFSYITWQVFLSVFILTSSGFIAGFIIAVVTRRSANDIIAIGIETACQNNAIAFLVLKFSFPKPYGDLAAVLPACNFLFLPISLGIFLALKHIIEFFRSKAKSKGLEIEQTNNEDGHGKITKNLQMNGIDNPVLEID